MNHSRPQLFGMLAGLFLAVGLVLSSMLATTAWLKIKNSQFISVKGSTHKDVASDLVIWSGDPFSVYSIADQVYVDGNLAWDAHDRAHQHQSDFMLGQPAAQAAIGGVR